MLLGEFDDEDRDRGRRNVLAVAVAKSGVHLGHLATAFGIGEEYLRRLRRKEEEGGPAALLLPRMGGKNTITAATRASWRAQFDAGLTPKAVWREQPRRGRHAYSAVWREHRAWLDVRASTAEATTENAASAPTADEDQLTLWPPTLTSVAAAVTGDAITEDEGEPEIVPMTARSVRSGQQVQHVGTWLMLALASELRLHEEADRALARRAHDHDALRIALDAIICALAIRQLCVEGVRRLATPSGPALLRAERVPSASRVRRLLGRLLADTDGGAKPNSAAGSEEGGREPPRRSRPGDRH